MSSEHPDGGGAHEHTNGTDVGSLGTGPPGSHLPQTVPKVIPSGAVGGGSVAWGGAGLPERIQVRTGILLFDKWQSLVQCCSCCGTCWPALFALSPSAAMYPERC